MMIHSHRRIYPRVRHVGGREGVKKVSESNVYRERATGSTFQLCLPLRNSEWYCILLECRDFRWDRHPIKLVSYAFIWAEFSSVQARCYSSSPFFSLQQLLPQKSLGGRERTTSMRAKYVTAMIYFSRFNTGDRTRSHTVAPC